MVINIKAKSKKIYFIIIFILIGGMPFICSSTQKPKKDTEIPSDISSNRLSTSDYEYICKVFTFTNIQNTYRLTFDLSRAYIHSIIVQVVTPHSCTMNITLWDSLDREFQIFYATISQASGEISTLFGTTESGNHTFQFQVINTGNLNIKITIRNTGIHCLYDKISNDEQRRMMFYDLTCFSNGYFIQHEISLLTDHRYKFYVGRTSSISMALSNRADVSYNISDPLNRDFQIYGNATLAGIADVNIFTFGTAIAGIYTIDIEIYCDVPWMNVAYVIIDDGKIGDLPPDTNQTSAQNFFWIPIEWGLLTVVGIGTIVGAVVVIILISKKRNRIIIRKRD
ncbi:MAG: hypothetical protein ACFFBH_16910 [Promethearchaeota archaeon]